MQNLKLYNSLTRQKETFTPLDPTHVRLYACGPTVYNYAHIGNARMAVVFDLWARLLRHLYPKVTYVSNITDIEDKIIHAARETGQPISAITEKYARIYNADMATLGVDKPDVQPLATTHVGEMIAQITQLVENGHAYAADGHVLFHVPSDPSYGALSGRSRDEQIAGARVEVAPYKQDPADFVLWKPSSGDEPGWESPWGFGRPGWHIECSAMAEKHLGLPFDIHGGGADLKFPHHENEIAQSCCAHNRADQPDSFAKYWVHNGFVTVNGEKMSKSLGNFLLVHDLINQYDGNVLRLALLSAHYRQPLDWSEQVLHQSQKLIEKITRKLQTLSAIEATAKIPDDILQALCDDLNTPQVFAALNKLLKTDLPDQEMKSYLLGAYDILGIQHQTNDPKNLDTEKIESLLTARTQAKKDKNFAQADAIRDELTAMGVTIEDTPDGPVWHVT